MGCSPWIPRNSSHRPQYDDTGASRHVESNTVEVLWVSAGFVATDFPSGPRPLPTHAQPACFPRPTKNSEEPDYGKRNLGRCAHGAISAVGGMALGVGELGNRYMHRRPDH